MHLWQRGFVYLVPVFCSQTRRGANRKRNFGANTCAPHPLPPRPAAPRQTLQHLTLELVATQRFLYTCCVLPGGPARAEDLHWCWVTPPTPQEAPRVAQAKFGHVGVF